MSTRRRARLWRTPPCYGRARRTPNIASSGRRTTAKSSFQASCPGRTSSRNKGIMPPVSSTRNGGVLMLKRILILLLSILTLWIVPAHAQEGPDSWSAWLYNPLAGRLVLIAADGSLANDFTLPISQG